MRKQINNKARFTSAVVLSVLMLALALPVMAQGGYRGNGPGPGVVAPTVPLTTDEAKWLSFMREEEKLAGDVYQRLHEKWNLTIFKNISASEDTHFNSVGNLLSRYGAPDPAQNNAAGVYSDARLNAMYNELIAKGMVSVKDALEVGVIIEKKDIEDLQAALAVTAKLDIKRVYTNLLNGSFNHLEAFETTAELCPLFPAN
jgi:hypothetical protein